MTSNYFPLTFLYTLILNTPKDVVRLTDINRR